MRIADLPWYDVAELETATDAWWRGIAGHLRRLGVDRVPEALTRDGSHVARWRDRELLLSQACGYDVLYDQQDDIVPIATPCYSALGCVGPRYRSSVVVRADRPWRTLGELRSVRVAVNEAASHSGTNALRALVAPMSENGRFFASVLVTGSHSDSLAALLNGDADVACVDAIVLALLAAVRPAAVEGLRTIVDTAPALAPPYVTSRHSSPELRRALQNALAMAVRDPDLARCRAALLLRDFVFVPATAYTELAAFESPAITANYFELPAPARSPLSTRVAAGCTDTTSRSACSGRRAEATVDRRDAVT